MLMHKLQMDKKPLMVAAWFGATTTTLIFSLVFLIVISWEQTILPTSQNFKLFASLPEDSITTTDNVDKEDARAKIIEDFFKGYKSHLSAYSQEFIAAAEKYNLDYRLLPAISMQESSGGKRVIEDSYNPFGYGIYGDLVIRFSSWEEGIERVARELREDYLNEGLITPWEIMTKYTPPSLAKGGAWANGVTLFMAEMR